MKKAKTPPAPAPEKLDKYMVTAKTGKPFTKVLHATSEEDARAKWAEISGRSPDEAEAVNVSAPIQKKSAEPSAPPSGDK